MHRRALSDLLDTYAACHPDEVDTAQRFREFIVANASCFERSLTIGHVTGSAWLVDPTGAAVLLTHHMKLDIWVQLGGHADGDPDTFAVARREATEESGLLDIAAAAPAAPSIFDLDIHRIPERGSEAAHFHYDVRYAFRATNDTRFRVSSESRALAWVPINNLATLTREPSMLRMAEKWLVQGNAS